MEESRDAEDAVRGLDGTRVCGSRVKVEISTGGKGGSRGGGGGTGGALRQSEVREFLSVQVPAHFQRTSAF